jgi:cytochrome c biogenesis protein CcmG, thiol:disulfide interchange protein DsbE
MKVFLKNIAVFIVLAFVFSALTSCTGTKTASVENNSTTTANTNKSASPEKPKINYPPAPAAIMQADVKNLDGTVFKLQDKKGKVILVNLWATWCLPCIKEMPHLVELQEKFKDQGFEIIGLDVDPESKEDIEAFAAKQKLNYQLGWAENSMQTEFVKISKMEGIPQSLLINREGQLTGVFTGGGTNTIVSLKETVEKVVKQ